MMNKEHYRTLAAWIADNKHVWGSYQDYPQNSRVFIIDYYKLAKIIQQYYLEYLNK